MVLSNAELFLRSNKGLLEDDGHEIDRRVVNIVVCFSPPHLATHVKIDRFT